MLIFQVVESLAGVATVAMPVLVHATPSCSSAVTGRGETVETVESADPPSLSPLSPDQDGDSRLVV